MVGRIPEETLAEIRDRTSLVDIVSQYVSLKRQGRNHVGLCPFHDEKTPSFSVSDDRGFFHCFGCGVGGTVFNFLMRIERIEFPEAAEQLARRAGINLPERGASGPQSELKQRLIELHEDAAGFYRAELAGARGSAARAYFDERGLEEATIELYGLGFAPASGSELSRRFGRRKISRAEAVRSGLLAERDGRVYDRFRGRVMFPIRDRRSRCIAFGGRTMGDDQPKYLNSPESPLFQKGEGLYGIAEARSAIREANRVVLVEGYMDALMLVQAGIPYVVATLGTALTVRQLRLLRSVAGQDAQVFFLFDGDRAGRQAALRAFGVCAEAGVWGRPAFLPDGMDPDDFVRRHGVDATLALLQKAPALFDYHFESVVPAGASVADRTRAAQEIGQILSRVPDTVQRELLAGRASERLGVSVAALQSRSPSTRPAERTAEGGDAPRWPVAERMLIEAMAADESAARRVMEDGVLALLQDSDLAAAGDRIARAWEDGQPISAVMDKLSQQVAAHLAGSLASADMQAEYEPTRIAHDCIRRIRDGAERARRRAAVDDLRRAERAGDDASREEALASLNEMRRREGERL